MREPFRDAAKRFRRVRKVLASSRSVSEEFGRSLRRREAFPKSSEGPRVVAKRFRRVRKVFAPSRSVSEEFGNLPSPESGPPISVLLFFFVSLWKFIRNIMKKELVTKETGRFGCSLRGYIYYLLFMLLACGGAFIWQFFLPHLGGQFTSWGDALGWQREIALWNIGLIIAIIVALRRRRLETLRLMTLQCSVLCWCLGLNHLVALCSDFSWDYGIHVMGVLEVMLLCGVWGFVLLLRKPGGIAVNNKD